MNTTSLISKPTIEILMAAYNGEAYVREQIESLQAQSYADWRLLISDDCSTDGTVAIVEEMAAADPRITLVEGARHGSGQANFRYLLTQAGAEYVMFCDQDDVWLPRKVELTVAKMRELEARATADVPCAVFTDMKVVDAQLHTIAPSFEEYSHFDPNRTGFRNLLAQNVAAGCTMMLNRPLVERMNQVPANQYVHVHDWWAMLVAAAFGRIGYVAEATSLYRQHGDNSIGATKYSATRKVLPQEERCRSHEKLLKQAASFVEVYGDELPADCRMAAEHRAAIMSTPSPVGRLAHQLASGAWSRDLRRKLGQVDVALRYRNPRDYD